MNLNGNKTNLFCDVANSYGNMMSKDFLKEKNNVTKF